MAFIYTWLSKNDAKTFKKNAKKRGETPYKYAQHLIKMGMEEESKYATVVTIVYWTLIFDLIVAAILLLL